MTLAHLKGPISENQYSNIIYFDRGGMGEIYTAVDSETNETVAIKVIRIEDSDTENLLNEEFKIAINLSHKNIVKTYFYSKFKDASGEYFYSVMEFLPAGNLRKKLLQLNSFIELSEVINSFFDLLNGLKEAHKTIIHRDIKPENIVISNTGSLKLCDFGIAKYVDSKTRTKTFKGYGSYPYMSPECWIGDINTPAMDIYSLGIVFFEILTLKRPYNGSTEREIRDQHLFEVMPTLIDYRNDTPILVSEIIQKMTNKKVEQRYVSIKDIIADLNESFLISETKEPHLQSVLEKAHRKLNTIKELELQRNRENEIYQEEQNFIKYSINELFNTFSIVCKKINSSLVEEQIIITSTIRNPSEASSMKLVFFNKIITVSFYAKHIIQDFIKSKTTAHHEEIFTKNDNLFLVGKVISNQGVKNREFGFNLILRKNKSEDIYYEWWVCMFMDSTMYANSLEKIYYPIEPMDFFYEYEIGREKTMHIRTMNYKKLEEVDIINLIGVLTE